MSEFTIDDVGKTFKDRDGKQWLMIEQKDIVLSPESVSGGDVIWQALVGGSGTVRTNKYGILRGDENLANPSVFIAPPAAVTKPQTVKSENRFIIPDIGDMYLDKWSGRSWKLFNITGDNLCVWHAPVDNHPDDILYTTLSGWQTTVSGDSVLPIKRMFDPSEAPVEVSGDIRMVVDNESRIDMIKATDPMTGKTASIVTISETPPAAALMQQQAAERSDTFEVPQEPLADAGDSGVKIEIGAVQSGKQAKAITEAGREALQELTDKGMDEAVVSKMVRVWENTMVGKYPPKLDLLPTQALAMVQQLLADPTSLPVHEHLGVKAERYYLAHSICAQLFRLERLIQEMD
jgi:hypothetical protein